MSRRRRKNNDGGIDMMSLILSVVFAIAWAFAGELLYDEFHGRLWTPLLIGFYFLGLALTQLLSIHICGLIRGRAAEGQYIIKAVCMILAVFIAAVGMDFVYEKVSFKDKGPSSLIFLIDDSVSMNTKWQYENDPTWHEPNDPDLKRVDAIKVVMSQCEDDFLFAVYDFNTQDSCKQQIPLTPASEVNNLSFDFFGDTKNTYIFDALNHILDDLEQGKLNGAGERPRIVLLTDGGSGDSMTEETAARAIENNVSICTVGFGDPKVELLEGIATKSNGVYVNSDNVDDLGSAMLEAASAVTEEQHNLLNYREKLDSDWVYFLIRMVFVLVLGCMFLYIKAQVLRTNVQELNVLPVYIILLVVGGLCLEIGINLMGWDEGVMHLLMCILFLANVTGHKSGKSSGNRRGYMSEQSSQQNNQIGFY